MCQRRRVSLPPRLITGRLDIYRPCAKVTNRQRSPMLVRVVMNLIPIWIHPCRITPVHQDTNARGRWLIFIVRLSIRNRWKMISRTCQRSCACPSDIKLALKVLNQVKSIIIHEPVFPLDAYYFASLKMSCSTMK
jgi:hypothetical protein